MAAEITCPVCTVPVEVADRFCCDMPGCPARGYRPDSPQARAIAARGITAGARAMDAHPDDYLTRYERARAEYERGVEYRDGYDQARDDAELHRAYLRVRFRPRAS